MGLKLYGLTGGIASGKSTVSRMFRELGATVIDADLLARGVATPGSPTLAAIARRFPGVLLPSGELDRAELGRRVFADPLEREALNALIHPAIAQAFQARREAEEAAGASVLIYDAALLFENGLERRMDGVVLVAVPLEVQRARLMSRDGLSPETADARLASQWPLQRKIPLARWVIDNSKSEAETREQVIRVWAQLQVDLR